MPTYKDVAGRDDTAFATVYFQYGERPSWWRSGRCVWYARFSDVSTPLMRCQDLEAVLTSLRELHPLVSVKDLARPLFLHAPTEEDLGEHDWTVQQLPEVKLSLAVADIAWAMRQEVTVLRAQERRQEEERRRTQEHRASVDAIVLNAADRFVAERVESARLAHPDAAEEAQKRAYASCVDALFGPEDERDRSVAFGLEPQEMRALMGKTGFYYLRDVCAEAMAMRAAEKARSDTMTNESTAHSSAVIQCFKALTALVPAYENIESVTWVDTQKGRVRYAISDTALALALQKLGIGDAGEPWSTLRAKSLATWRGRVSLKTLTQLQLDGLNAELMTPDSAVLSEEGIA